MDKKPTVSVIIPNYNHASYLRERIDSVLNQTFQDFEIILLDDHSTDNSPNIISEYKTNPHVSCIVINTENSGNTFLQWERGMNLARGEYLWIAESDDVAEPQLLEVLLDELRKNPKATVAYSHSIMIDSNGRPMDMTWHSKGSSGEIKTYDGTHYAKKKMLVYNHIYNASMAVFCRSAVANIPKDYQQYSYSGDWLFWTYICMQGQVIEVCRTLNRYRQHNNKVSNRASLIGRNWSNNAGVLSAIASLLHLNVFQQHCLRGKCTKHFRKYEKTIRTKEKCTTKRKYLYVEPENDIFKTIEDIYQQYPKIYGGKIYDICLYEIGKIFGFLSKD